MRALVVLWSAAGLLAVAAAARRADQDFEFAEDAVRCDLNSIVYVADRQAPLDPP